MCACTAAPQMGSRHRQQRWHHAFDWTRWCKWDLVIVFSEVKCCKADAVSQEGKERLVCELFFSSHFSFTKGERTANANGFQLLEASGLSVICCPVHKDFYMFCLYYLSFSAAWRTHDGEAISAQWVYNKVKQKGQVSLSHPSPAQSQKNFPQLHSCTGFESAKT